MGGKVIKVNSDKRMNGKEVVIGTNSDVKIYDVSDLAEYPGAPAQLQKYDGISAVANAEGDVVGIYITERVALLEKEKKHCVHCN